MARQVKDSALSVLWLGSWLWLGLILGLGTSHVAGMAKKKKNKKCPFSSHGFPIEQTMPDEVLTKWCLYYVSMVSTPKTQIFSLFVVAS